MKISIVSPSSPLNEEQIKQSKESINYLASLEHEINYSRSLFDTETKPREERAEQFMEEYLSEDNDILLASRGGSSAIEILDLLDFEKLFAAKRKAILGYSDLTTLALAFSNYAQKNSLDPIPFYHSPMLFELSSWLVNEDIKPQVNFLISRKAFENNLRILANKINKENFTFEKSELALELSSSLHDQKSVILEDSSISVLGGNLSIICSLVGTPYLPSFQNTILFIEECNEATYTIERMLWQLHLSGSLNSVKELWIGKALNAEYPDDLIQQLSSIHSFRTIRDLPVGHGDLNLITKLF